MILIDTEAWTVYHAEQGRELTGVLWIDTDKAEWCQYAEPLQALWGIGVSEIHRADRIEVDEAALRVTINLGKWPQLPPEVWNRRPVDAQRAWAAVLEFCK